MRVMVGVFIFTVATGCGQPKTTHPVATVGKKELVLEEVQQHLPPNCNVQDSETFARRYTEEWLVQEALSKAAFDSTKGLDNQLTYKVQDYRRKLILTGLMHKVLKGQLDTIITPTELQDYYIAHQAEYPAEVGYYQYFHIKTYRWRDMPNVRQLLLSKDSTQRAFLFAWAKRKASAAKLDSSWANEAELGRLQASAPLSLKASFAYPIIYSDVQHPEDSVHFFALIGVITPGQNLPLSVAAPALSDAIINQRKIRLLDAYEKKVLQTAYANNEIHVFH